MDPPEPLSCGWGAQNFNSLSLSPPTVCQSTQKTWLKLPKTDRRLSLLVWIIHHSIRLA